MTNPIVFLSHASPDDDFVRELDIRLSTRGLQVINDERSFGLGDSLVRDIVDNGIAKAAACVLVLSRASSSRPWPREELDASVVQAVTRGMKLIPVFLDDVAVPPALQHRIYYKVGDRNSKSEIDRVALRIELAVRGVDGLAEDAAMPITDSSTVAKRVKRELLVRLQGHFENLWPLFFHRSVDVQRWRAAHQELYDRAMEPE
jgi:hypothetical protein